MLCDDVNALLRLRIHGELFESSFEAFLEDFEQFPADNFEGKYNLKHLLITL